MNKLQAAMRDKSAKGFREAKLYYKVGSCFKGCFHCGDIDEDRGIFKTGTQVFRSYKPKDIGWTYKCMDCGAVDAACWENASDVGKEPILKSRDDMATYRKELREQNKPEKQLPQITSREREILALRAQLEDLRQMMKK